MIQPTINKLYNKYNLQSRNQYIIYKHLQNLNSNLKSKHKKCLERPRFLNCNHSVRQWNPKLESNSNPKPIVEVRQYKINDFTGHYVSGLFRCGSVWACPACASKIVLHRSRRLKTYLSRLQPGNYCMVTETWPHHKKDPLKKCWKRAKNFRKFRNSRNINLKKFQSWKSILKEFKIDKIVMTYDTTWTPRNGWHHHCHSIYISNCYIPITKLHFKLSKNFYNETLLFLKRYPETYSSSVIAGNLSNVVMRGLKISRPPNPAKYISKIGFEKYILEKYSVAEEVVGANAKRKNKDASFQPWLLNNPNLLWEYLNASKGEKLINPWPREFGKELNDLTDDEILMLSPKSKSIGHITHEEWRNFRKTGNVQNLIDQFTTN